MPNLKDTLPVTYLLITTHGRINRRTYWLASALVWSAFYSLFQLIVLTIGYSATLVLYPLLFWTLVALASKRLHDIGLSAYWISLVLLPLAGPLALIFLLGFKKGQHTPNKFGSKPGTAPDYFVNPDAYSITHINTKERIVDDVTQLNPIIVADVIVPTTIAELSNIVKHAERPISVGGGRFSMGGQTASPQSLHIDMRKLNAVVDFSPTDKWIKVEAGIRWCDIQQRIDEHGLSAKVMQTYANFTVGGSLSVNCHGRYIGLGPVILSVTSIELMLANGSIVEATRDMNSELFYGSIGCYNALGIIVSATLALEDNVPVKRSQKKMLRNQYKAFFFGEIRNNPDVVFHNGDLYPPSFRNVRAVSWTKTTEKPTEKTRLMPLAAAYPLERYFIGAFSRSRFGKWRREFIVDPIFYSFKKIHWRNYEAGYDVLELEPESRSKSTYVLQEYFVPANHFDGFTDRMAEIFQRHKVNVINISARHAKADNGSLLAWARAETFAFVVWYKQLTTDAEKARVGVWTREMIDAALAFGGSYYLPYQVHATEKQFHKAYPRAMELLALKRKFDPDFKFRNVLWNTYYKP